MAIIYALRCRDNGKSYIGCTNAKLSKRFREHRCLLNNNRHNEPLLQSDWNLFGASKFEILPLYLLPPDAPLALKRNMELHFMTAFDIFGKLYNTNRTSFSFKPEVIRMGVEASRHVEGNKRSPEANLKRRLSQLGKPKGHGAKISATKQAKKRMSDEIV